MFVALINFINNDIITLFITPISLVVPVGSKGYDLLTNRTIFCLKSHLFPANEEATLKTNFQNSYFPPQKWMNFISNKLSTTSIKYLNWSNPVFGRFQNGCNKVVIESRVVQFWPEIILMISNWTRTARAFDFEITRMISAQIALHSVQLPL